MMLLSKRVQRPTGSESKANSPNLVVIESRVRMGGASDGPAWINDKRMFFAPLESFGMEPRTVSVAGSGSTLAAHVNHVFLLRSEEQVGRIHAGWVVTAMADEKILRDASVMEFPRDPMPTAVTKDAVPVFITASGPFPAIIGRSFSDLVPKALFGGKIRSSHTASFSGKVVRGSGSAESGPSPVPSFPIVQHKPTFGGQFVASTTDVLGLSTPTR